MTVAMTGVHRRRFGAAMDEYRRRRSAEPNRAWRALLLLTTAAPGLWERTRDHIDWEQMRLVPAAVPVASYDEAQLLRVAANLLGPEAISPAKAHPDATPSDKVSSEDTSSDEVPSNDTSSDKVSPPDTSSDEVSSADASSDRVSPPDASSEEVLAALPRPVLAVDVRDVAENMDGALWRVVMLAWEEYQKRR